MIFNPRELERAITFIKKQFERGKFVKIEYITESKTLSQNAYLWLVLTHAGFESGNDKDDLYQYYIKKFSMTKEIEFNGVIDVVPITLSKFSKEQASRFIDSVCIDLRTEGFDVPNPEDKRVLEMYQFYKEKGLL